MLILAYSYILALSLDLKPLSTGTGAYAEMGYSTQAHKLVLNKQFAFIERSYISYCKVLSNSISQM